MLSRSSLLFFAAYLSGCPAERHAVCTVSADCPGGGLCVDGVCARSDAGPDAAHDADAGRDAAHDADAGDSAADTGDASRDADAASDAVLDADAPHDAPPDADAALDAPVDGSGDPVMETCNGADDDGDGEIDEAFAECGDSDACTVDACVAGTCVNGPDLGGALLFFDTTCPAEFSEVTSLRNRFLRGHNGDAVYGEAAGVSSHRHSLAAHTHSIEAAGGHTHATTVASETTPYMINSSSTPIIYHLHNHPTATASTTVDHTHAIASAAENLGFANNLPAYREIVACEANSGTVVIPEDAIALYDQGCPAGWDEVTSFHNRMPRGHDGDGTYAETGGSDTHSHTTSHTHTLETTTGSHGHSVTIAVWAGGPGLNAGYVEASGTGSIATMSHVHSGSTLESVSDAHTHTAEATEAFDATDLPEWREYVFCRKDASTENQIASVALRALWVDGACPTCWSEVPGTQDRMVRGSDGDGTYEEQGGESVHSHDAAHDHAASTSDGSHAHTLNIATPESAKAHVSGVSVSTSSGTHAHTGSTAATDGSHSHSVLNTSTTMDDGELVPPYTEVTVCSPD